MSEKKLIRTVQRAKFVKWIAERMQHTTEQLIAKHLLVTKEDFPQYTGDHVDAEEHLLECKEMIYLSIQVIDDFKRYSQTTEDKADRINRLWEIYGNVPERV